MKIETLEWLLLIPTLAGLIRGWTRGLIREIIGLLSIIIALLGTMVFHEAAVTLLFEYTSESGAFMDILAYVLVFFVIMIILNLIGKALTKLLDSAQLGQLNRALGSVFSALKWTIVLALGIQLVFALNQRFEWFDSQAVKEHYALLSVYQSLGEWLTAGLIEWWNSGLAEDHFKTAAIPGNVFPSRYSSIAPPPVDT